MNKLDDVRASMALETILAYNKAVMTKVPFDPNVKDGRGTIGLSIPKSNWANTIDQPPFEAYAVTCGLTFTFAVGKLIRAPESWIRTACRSLVCSQLANLLAAFSISIILAAPA